MDIIFEQDKAISPIAVYQLKGASASSTTDPVDRAGLTPSNKVYIAGTSIDTPWAPWGYDNKCGHEQAEKIQKSGVLTATISAKARIAIGKGIVPVIVTGRNPKTGEEELEWIYDAEIEDWLELNNDFINSYNSIRNFTGHGWTHSRVFLDNAKEKIARYKTDDVVKCRLGVMNATTGEIEKTFFSPCWRDVSGSDSKLFKEITMLRENYETDDLQQRIKDGTNITEFSIISRGDLDGHNYYPKPMWHSVRDWVDLVIRVPKMKDAMFNNQMTIKYLITIDQRYFERGDSKWNSYTPEEKQAKFATKVADINKHLSGNDNSYKSIAVSSYVDPTGTVVKDITIEVLDDKVKDGKLLPESSAGDKQILFSMMMNPTIMGANTYGGGEGGAGSGSDIREAYIVQIMLMEAERRMNSKIFNIIKRVNGWSDKYKGKNLQFRYPNLILTTLDKGGSTAPVNP